MKRYIPITSLIFLLFVGISYGQEADTISIEHIDVIPMNEEVTLIDQRVTIANGKILRVDKIYQVILLSDGRR